MTSVVVIGGGIAGLGVAVALADHGIPSTVCEQDLIDDPVELDRFLEEPSHRRSTPQDRHSHTLLGLARELLINRAPGLWGAFLAAGARESRFVDHLPVAIADSEGQPDEEELIGLMCRRPVLEWALRGYARQQSAITYAGRVEGLELATPEAVTSAPKVTGVRVDGRVLPADVVIDAGGRNSPVPRWLNDFGIALPEPETEACGIVYLTRFYRLRSQPGLTLNRGVAAGGFGPASAGIAFPGDNDGLSITLGLLPGDPAIRQALKPDRFEAAVRLHPLVEPWIDPSLAEPTSSVAMMANLSNRLQKSTIDGRPAVVGLVSVGDAACISDPAFGRGISLAFVQAWAVADLIAKGTDDLNELALAVDDLASTNLRPWFDDAVAQDRTRTARWQGQAGPASGPGPSLGQLARAAELDREVWRAAARRFNLLDPPGSVFGDDHLVQRISRVANLPTGGPSPFGPPRTVLADALGV